MRNEGLEKRDKRHVETDWWGKWGKSDVTREMGRSLKSQRETKARDGTGSDEEEMKQK